MTQSTLMRDLYEVRIRYHGNDSLWPRSLRALAGMAILDAWEPAPW